MFGKIETNCSHYRNNNFLKIKKLPNTSFYPNLHVSVQFQANILSKSLGKCAKIKMMFN